MITSRLYPRKTRLVQQVNKKLINMTYQPNTIQEINYKILSVDAFHKTQHCFMRKIYNKIGLERDLPQSGKRYL